MDFISAVERYARASGRTLAPEWDAELRAHPSLDDVDAPLLLQSELEWPQPERISGRPRADQFPLLTHDPDRGWIVATQWDDEDSLLIAGEREPVVYSSVQSFFSISPPDPLADDTTSALSIFVRAIKRRKSVLVVAAVATVFANLLALAVSFYAMQLYDRVIPLASFETLAVLTVGVGFALLLDLILRSLRALLIELEAQNIDREVSEYFFARAQAIRLDARPQAVGTMASQIQGQEQIRQAISSSSVFVIADLPFALFFILVIASIGGAVAIVPIVSLPIAIGLALLLARIIRNGAERAQVSGNQKNGLLVEMLDASETVKANRGGWMILSRWNRLLRQIHHFEYPVKRASAVSSSLFSSLQQMTYVAVMGFGAYLAATGEITTGALLACSILVGRINGPLVAQLPNLIVQWGYARSALKMLDGILKLPLEPSASRGAMRPESLRGPIMVKQAGFAYPEQKAAIEIEGLRIEPGERVAIIGGVGAGKTTLLKVLAGLYSAQSGSVTVNGLDIANVAEDVTRRHIGYLPQNVRLIRGTLRDNLTMGMSGLEDETLINLAKATRLNVLLGEQQGGLETQIFEGGSGLSGGQRAIVGINRMIHASPGIWLLDEPTSSLDLASELAVLTALDDAMAKDDILVMTTHKLALLERFTRIVMMVGGRIARDGTADVVLDEMRKASQPPPSQSGHVTSSLKAGGAS
ncbi:ATP-binding cassette domain-containing protein [Altererythrobacter lutimaris]|uniref:ATP-binding cassette domain-containing protein n=1 Tax=Altererythrobacter lutimaris TaxID=2743979 RepID=A0A850HHY2_9SPHN|nr:ATP-binding cassette domain-containing protein [Altererythrobacter lutimaris]NVE94942.1 ATP-binding cassette domain-containing protein [Altererythrobacter lutimaris]